MLQPLPEGKLLWSGEAQNSCREFSQQHGKRSELELMPKSIIPRVEEKEEVEDQCLLPTNLQRLVNQPFHLHYPAC